MPTLFWYLVYIHLTSQQGIFLSEIMNYSTPRSSNEINTSDTDFDKLLTSDLLNSGLKETLRLQAHNLSPRKMDEDTILKVEGKDYLLRKGTMAFAPSTLINWNPDIYEHPAEWKADRFVEKDVREESFSEHEHHIKKDIKKLKFALPIWGGGIHMVDRSKTRC
jgi:cytochrome P450